MHIQTKHEGVKYACNQCDQQFTQQSSLTTHIQSQHEGVKYACNQCDYQATEKGKVPTMVGFWEKSRKSDQMPYFGQKLVGFLGLQRNLEEFSRNSGIYLHDNV